MKNVVIFSVFRNIGESIDLKTNKIEHDRVLTLLNEFGAAQALGYYKGNMELSIVLPLNPLNLVMAKNFADKYNQESILVVDELSNASLLYQTNKRLPLGKMKAIGDHEANKLESYTWYKGEYYSAQ